ncbi:MAG: PHP domain-containing protein [Clostridiales bacterium]|nr:PHP domain-containing protein [Clostridiales bacterium]
MTKIAGIDLHMHSTVSDGSDTPEEILAKAKEAGLDLFALTDHDAIEGCKRIRDILTPGDPVFVNGVEFSCRDEDGKYHILGYDYDPESDYIKNVVRRGHEIRMNKARKRADFVVNELGCKIPEEEIERFLSLPNPGKPHLGNLLVKYGYARDKQQAIDEFINKAKTAREYVRPEFAIEGIKKAGGIPVLAHPVYGSGGELIMGDEMDQRLRKLISFGLEGVEAFYSEFSAKMRRQMVDFADRYSLYITAGSDYHGKNKMIALGDNGLSEVDNIFPGNMERFIRRVMHDGY